MAVGGIWNTAGIVQEKKQSRRIKAPAYFMYQDTV